VISLRSAAPVLNSIGCRILGVSTDPPAEQKKFVEKYRLQYDLIADRSGQVCDAFGVPYPKNRAYRETMVYRKGRLIWWDPRASTKYHAQDISYAIIRQQQKELASGESTMQPIPPQLCKSDKD